MQAAGQTDDKQSYTTTTQSPAETRALGERLGRLLKANQVIALQGELGAGKTVLTQGIAAGLGITVRVTSPTFTLVNEYQTPTPLRLVHIDSYRLGETSTTAETEAATFGLEEILDATDAVVIIEWAERVASLLPADYLQIALVYGASATRQLTLTAWGPQSTRLLQALSTGAPY